MARSTATLTHSGLPPGDETALIRMPKTTTALSPAWTAPWSAPPDFVAARSTACIIANGERPEGCRLSLARWEWKRTTKWKRNATRRFSRRWRFCTEGWRARVSAVAGTDPGYKRRLRGLADARSRRGRGRPLSGWPTPCIARHTKIFCGRRRDREPVRLLSRQLPRRDCRC